MSLKNQFLKLSVAIVIAVVCSTVVATAQTMFYGATKIQAPAGTQIDLRNDARYRIFARDENGNDISHNITIDGDNWNVTVPTTVTYRVAGVSQTVELGVSATENQIIQRTLYTLSKDALAAINVTGAERGPNHDRQHLGVYMPQGSTLRVRRVYNYATNWNIRMIQGRSYASPEPDGGDRSWDNFSGTGWQIFNNNTPNIKGGIPLVRTPKTEELNGNPAIIEVELSGNVTELNYFHYGDHTADFLNRWSGNHYALLGNSVVNIMVSEADRDDGWFTTKEFANNISGLLNMYAQVVAYFNEWIGLDINATHPRNRLVNTKYLVVPKREGAGLAFYSYFYCGFSIGNDGGNSNHNDYYGKAGNFLERSWIVPHEVGHGYEGNFSGSKEISLGEVMNNVLGTYWEMTFLDFTKDDERKRSWIFDASNPPTSVDNKVAEHRYKGYVSVTDFRELLYLMMTLSNAGAAKPDEAHHALQSVHCLNRETINWSIADLYAKGLADSRETNIIPFMESFGFAPSFTLKSQVFEEGNRIAQPFRDITNSWLSHVLPDDGRLLWGSLSLVRPNDISLGTGAAGTITINIDDLNLIKGQNISIKDGKNIVHTATIEDKTVSVPAGFPAGAYYIDLPSVTGYTPHITGYNILNVKEGSAADATVNYKALTVSHATELTRLEMRGHNEAPFATIDYDADNNSLIIESFGVVPHPSSWGSDNLYCKIEIYRGDTRLWSKDYYSIVTSAAGTYYQDIQVGDVIRIYHREPTLNHRPRAVNAITGKTLTNYTFAETTTLEVTQYGIMLRSWSETVKRQVYTDNFNNFLDYVVKNVIPADKMEGMDDYNDIKAWLLAGSQLLSNTDRADFENNYGSMFRLNNGNELCNELGHLWGEWVVTKPATATEEGSEMRSCTRDGCFAMETQPIPSLLTNNPELARVNPLRAYVDSGILHVTGLTNGETLSIYNSIGQLICRRVVTSEEMDVQLTAQGVYIIQSGRNNVKIVFSF